MSKKTKLTDEWKNEQWKNYELENNDIDMFPTYHIIQKDSEKIFLTTKDIFQNIFQKMKDFVEFSKYRKNSDYHE